MTDTVKLAAAPHRGHPLAGTTLTGAQMIVQVIADQGLTAIFGYSGGAILPTYDAVFLYNAERARQGLPQLPLIVPANEQGELQGDDPKQRVGALAEEVTFDVLVRRGERGPTGEAQLIAEPERQRRQRPVDQEKEEPPLERSDFRHGGALRHGVRSR